MAASGEERRQFGARLRALREMADMSADALAQQMTRRKHKTSAASVTAWERGAYAPQRRATVELLEDIFDGGGELLRLLGYGVPLDKQEELDGRVSQLEAQMALVRGQLEEVLDMLRGGPSPPAPAP